MFLGKNNIWDGPPLDDPGATSRVPEAKGGIIGDEDTAIGVGQRSVPMEGKNNIWDGPPLEDPSEICLCCVHSPCEEICSCCTYPLHKKEAQEIDQLNGERDSVIEQYGLGDLGKGEGTSEE